MRCRELPAIDVVLLARVVGGDKAECDASYDLYHKYQQDRNAAAVALKAGGFKSEIERRTKGVEFGVGAVGIQGAEYMIKDFCPPERQLKK